MILVALETATRHGSVALVEGERTVERDVDLRGEGVVAGLWQLLGEQGVSPRKLDAVAVSVGPGSFTGVRIGVAAAQGICLATGADAVAVGTLEGLAWCGSTSDWGLEGTLLLPSVDAGRNEVYAALYRAGPAGTPPERLWGPETVSAERLAHQMSSGFASRGWGKEGVLVGSGAEALADLFPEESGWFCPSVLGRARAAAVARAGLLRLERGDGHLPEELEPVYLRKSDAEIHREKRQ